MPIGARLPAKEVPMRKMVRKIDVLSAGKIGVIIYGCLGLIVGVFVALFSMAGAFAGAMAHGGPRGAFLGMFFGVGAIIVFPILYGVIGAIMLMIVSLIYNTAAGIVGGLEFEVEDK